MTVREATRIALQESGAKEEHIQKALDKASITVPGGKGSEQIPEGHEREFIDRVKATYAMIRMMPKPVYQKVRNEIIERMKGKAGAN